MSSTCDWFVVFDASSLWCASCTQETSVPSYPDACMHLQTATYTSWKVDFLSSRRRYASPENAKKNYYGLFCWLWYKTLRSAIGVNPQKRSHLPLRWIWLFSWTGDPHNGVDFSSFFNLSSATACMKSDYRWVTHVISIDLKEPIMSGWLRETTIRLLPTYSTSIQRPTGESWPTLRVILLSYLHSIVYLITRHVDCRLENWIEIVRDRQNNSDQRCRFFVIPSATFWISCYREN